MSVAARVLSDRTRPDADPRVFVTGSNPSSLSMPTEGPDVVAIGRVVTNSEPSAEGRTYNSPPRVGAADQAKSTSLPKVRLMSHGVTPQVSMADTAKIPAASMVSCEAGARNGNVGLSARNLRPDAGAHGRGGGLHDCVGQSRFVDGREEAVRLVGGIPPAEFREPEFAASSSGDRDRREGRLEIFPSVGRRGRCLGELERCGKCSAVRGSEARLHSEGLGLGIQKRNLSELVVRQGRTGYETASQQCAERRRIVDAPQAGLVLGPGADLSADDGTDQHGLEVRSAC